MGGWTLTSGETSYRVLFRLYASGYSRTLLTLVHTAMVFDYNRLCKDVEGFACGHY